MLKSPWSCQKCPDSREFGGSTTWFSKGSASWLIQGPSKQREGVFMNPKREGWVWLCLFFFRQVLSFGPHKQEAIWITWNPVRSWTNGWFTAESLNLENQLLLISINWKPQNQPQLPKKMVLSYVFQEVVFFPRNVFRISGTSRASICFSRWFNPWPNFIPDRWRSRFQPFQKGHVNSPSQKGHDLNHQVRYFSFFLDSTNQHFMVVLGLGEADSCTPPAGWVDQVTYSHIQRLIYNPGDCRWWPKTG